MLEWRPGPIEKLAGCLLEGLELGASDPELATKLWASGVLSYERDASEWSRRGLSISTGILLPSIEEAGQVAQDVVREYVRAYRPDVTGLM